VKTREITRSFHADRTLAQLAANRQAAAVGLVTAIGGGWKAGAEAGQ